MPIRVGGVSTTPLIQAAGMAVLESVQLLLGAGASVNASDELGHTAFMTSLRSPSADAAAVLSVVGALLAAGSDVYARDLAGDTALHHLARHSHEKPWAAAAARLLRDSGADASITNKAGLTPAQAVPAAARGGELHRLLLAAPGA